MSRYAGYSPELWVLGKMRPLPGANSNPFLDSASASFSELNETTDSKRFMK